MLALGACFVTGLLLHSPEDATGPSPEVVAVESSSGADTNGADSELWLVTRPAKTATEAVAPAVPEEPPAPAEHPWLEQTVKRGDNLSLIFQRAGFSKGDVHSVVSESADGKTLARIYPGQVLAFQAGDDGQLMAVRYVKSASALETIYYRRGETGFSSEIETREPEVRESWATGEISSSLFMAGQEAGLSQTMIMELANVFGGVIDFVQDPRQGDTIHLVYEELYLDGEKYADGNIIAASFTNQGKTYNAFRFVDSNGEANYYNEEGVSMRKAFLLAPVDFTRISSNFNLKRLHPIYKTTRPHRGTDYAAPTGTPVYAAGDGRVIKAGYTRANGNYVFLQHGDRYVTRYLHLHKRNVKQGQRVAQSQVIGTVGSTGAATGPHLHYEFLLDGVHRDPRKIHKQLPKAKTLAPSEMTAFRQATNQSSMQLAALRTDSHLAMNNQGDAKSRAN
ncbi:MAG: peptidoglycan DD-metalloendopeptidase family protein [Halieaceae bacterium]|nr:peptidoglycan DD-metalloendopeptidase family protein [Halieaceae bacterium]